MGVVMRMAIARNEFCRGGSLRLPSRPISTIQFSHKAPEWYASRSTRGRFLSGALPSPSHHKIQMKSVLAFVCLCSFSLSAPATMSRVVTVIDSRTIVVEVDRVRSSVVLNGIAVAADEETTAAEFLRRLVGGAWVLVEHGDVYRSPDGLYVNGEMNRRAWRTPANMRYLGEFDPGVGAASGRRLTAAAAPARSVAAATPGRRRIRSKPRSQRAKPAPR